MTYPDGSYITYEYDNLNRLTKIKDDSATPANLAEYTYDSRSRRKDLTYLNETTIDYTYDAASRLTTIDSTTDNGSHEYDYTYDKVGNRLTMLVNNTDTHSYTYDDIYQITDVDYPSSYESWVVDTTFNYDDVGNRSSVVDDGTTNYEANNLNQYNSVGGVYYDYDENGNTIFDGVAYYTYDSENRLTSATNASGSTGGMFNAALDNFDLTFTTGGNANWAPVKPDAHDPNFGGLDSVKSGDISANEETYLDSTVNGEGTLKFYYKKNSDSGDCFCFKIDGSNELAIYNGSSDWTQKTCTITGSSSHTLQWYYSKGSGGSSSGGGAWVDRVEWIPSGSSPTPTLAESLDCELTITTGGNTIWHNDIGASSTSYYDNDATYSDIGDDEEAWMQTTVTAVAGDKVSFYWKVSSESGSDYLKFYIDNQYQDGISGEVDWQKKSYSLSAGSRTLKWVYSKNSSDTSGDDQGWVDGLLVGTGSLVIPPDEYSEALDSHLKFTRSGDSPSWFTQWGTCADYYYDGDSLRCSETLTDEGDEGKDSCLQTIVESDSSETIKFHWKVSSRENYDYFQFYIDGTLQHQITGEQDWQQKEYTLSAGIHTLKWRYVKGAIGGDDGDNCGWVDFVQWSGPSPEQDPSNFQTINYKYDLYGRRSEKKVDGYSTRYVYDGPHVIAEYDGNNNLLRKYIYGPGIDQPVCMIEVADSNAVYYYHYDGLGSVVALSDSSGDTVQTYQYSVYGQVAVEDINHPNPYMFAGRRFDIEIGLYYNRARYYNPYTGRFLQTDPIGYGDGMNMYAYCGNNPIGRTDPSGCHHIPANNPDGTEVPGGLVHIHVTIPVEIILYSTEGLSDLDISMATHDWFDDQGVLDNYVGSWNLDHVTVNGDNLDLVIYSWWNTFTKQPVDAPNIGTMTTDVVADCTLNIWGQMLDPTVVDTVPLLKVDGIVILDNKALNRLIKPAIQEINNWSNDAFIVQKLVNMGYHWDSWFADKSMMFKYDGGSIYNGIDINYIVGGHAFRHYGFSEKMMMRLYYRWKAGYGHKPDDPLL